LVDAAQSVGVLPLDLAALDVDFYAFTGHKWLCGPDGVGGLYVRPELQEVLRPTFIGWRGIQTDACGNPQAWKPDGSRFEIATSAFPLYCGLRAAIELHRTWAGADARYQRICALSQALWARLQDIPKVQCLRTTPPESGLVSFQLEGGSHPQLVQALENQGVMIRFIAHPNCARVCVHYLTLESELEEFVGALQKLLDS
ncbi:MAG TPA: aminotransferase class V-fold PLP-dependent enzyme, partial [Stenomitos sp.]